MLVLKFWIYSALLNFSYGSDYNFGVFENFGETKQIFESQKTILKTVELLKNLILDRKKLLLDFSSAIEDLEDVSETLQSIEKSRKNEINLISKIEEKSQKLKMNSTDTMTALTTGMVQLYDNYHFDLEEILLNGSLKHHGTIYKSYNKLLPSDYLLFSKIAIKLKKYNVCIDFVKAAEKNIGLEPTISSIKTTKALKKNKNICASYNNKILSAKKAFIGSNFKVHPYFVDPKTLEMTKIPKNLNAVEIDSNNKVENLFFNTCKDGRAGNLRAKCHFLHHNDPYLKLGPFKLEVLSTDPYIVIFRDIMSKDEMNYLVTEATPYLSNRRLDHGNQRLLPHEIRSGKVNKIIHKTVQMWLSDKNYALSAENIVDDKKANYIRDEIPYNEDHPKLIKLSQKLEMATNLNILLHGSATMYQVTNYGLGGLCQYHYDPQNPNYQKYSSNNELNIPHNKRSLHYTGDYLGTLIGWINDDPVEGATAFPKLGINIYPKKGSVAFWYNIYKCDILDKSTMHGGCPVLKGTKWTFNRWIYQYNQLPKMPCGLKISDKYTKFEGIY